MVIPRNVVTGIGRGLKGFGIGTAFYSTVSATLDYNAGNISGTHLTTNLIMTGVGFVWPIGTILSVGYSIVAEDMIFKEDIIIKEEQ